MTMVGVLSSTTVFLWIALVVILYAFNSAPIIPMMDSTVMDMLGEHKEHYGKLRLWGAVGWGLSAPVIGWLIEGKGMQWSFWGYLIQMAVVFVVVMNLPVAHASLGGRYWQGLRSLLQDMRWRLFFLVVFVSGIGSSVLSNYLFLRLNDLGASTTLMGTGADGGNRQRAACILFLGEVDEALGSALAPGVFAVCVCSAGLDAFPFLPTAWLMLPVQLLHGLTFSHHLGSRGLLRPPDRPSGDGQHRARLIFGYIFWPGRLGRRADGRHPLPGGRIGA